MWKHIFKSGRNEGRLLSPEIFENDIGYIDGRSQFIVIDGYSFQEKYHSKTGEKIRSHAVVDGSYFIHTRHETGEIIYRYVNCEIEQVIECNMHYCWVQSDDCVLCYEDPTADQNNDTEDFNRCYDLNTGKNLWERVIRTDFYAQKDSETGIFFMNEEGNKLYRLNPATGETLWDIDLPEGVKTANEPIRVYDNVIAISLEKTVKQRGGRDLRLCFMWGLNPNTGERLWEISHRSLFFFKEPKTGLLHNFSSASKAFGEKEYFYESIDPVAGKLLSQKEVSGEYEGWEVGTVSPHLKTLDNGILYFKADNRVIGRFNINSQCVEYAQVLEELTSQRFSEPQIYGNRMLVTDDNNCFHVYEWVE